MQKSMSISGMETTLRIEEALEEQFVLQRIDVGDLHAVGDQRSGGRSTARADGDSLLSRVADEVPDDHEVAGKLHLLDAVEFAIEARIVVGESSSEQAAIAQVRDRGVETLAAALRGRPASK